MPLDAALLRRLTIQPLSRDRHDRAAFASGEPRVDTYLQTRAAGLADVDGTRVWVASVEGSTEIVGFYALNAHGIDASAIPPNLRRKLPRDHPVPATFLSNIATASRYQGRGIGGFLLADAFRNTARAAEIVGSAFIVLDALSERAARFYRRHGFIDLPTPPGRMVIGMRQVRAAIVAAVTDPDPLDEYTAERPMDVIPAERGVFDHD